MPKSKKLWLFAAKMEDSKKKKAVLLKALENIPKDVQLWKEAISLEDEAGAR
jgi:hypothetical protein